jgi:hypothetical protein
MANAAWHVEGNGITQSTTLAKGGAGVIDVYVVPYMIDSGPATGHEGTVTIAASAYNPANVKAAIDAQVNATHDIAGLSSANA